MYQFQDKFVKYIAQSDWYTMYYPNIYICNTFLNQHCSSYEDVPIYIPM